MIDARRWATGLNAVLVAALVVAAAAVASEVARDHRVQLDLSEDRAGTLDPDLLAAVRGLAETSVRVTAFSAQAKDDEAWVRDRKMRDFLDALDRASDRIETTFVEFDRDRLTAERLGVDRYGTVVLESAADRIDLSDREVFRARGPKGARDVTFIGASAVAGALRKLVSERATRVILTTGHGEVPIFDRGIGELKGLQETLDQQGFTARTLDLLADAGPAGAAIPADAAVVLVIGPRAPFAEAETAALRSYLARGGSLGVFVDPGGAPPAVLAELGVELDRGVVLDPTSFLPDLDRPLLRYGRHEITTGLAADDVPTVVSVAGPLAEVPTAGVVGSALVQTSRQGWAERGTESPAAYTPGADRAGPVVVGAAYTTGPPHPWSGARVVVVGDVDWLRDDLLDQGPGNATFLVETLRWLGRGSGPVARPTGVAAVRRLELGASQLAVVRGLLLIGMPGLVGALGVAVAVARRQR